MRPQPGGRLRILIVTPRFSPDVGGVERHVAEIAPRLTARGCDVTVLCTDRTGCRARHDEIDGVRVVRVRAWPAGSDYYLAPGLWREMGRHRCDVAHVQSYHTAVAPIAMARAVSLRVPFVVTFHGGGHSSPARTRLRVAQRRSLRPLLRRAARLVAVANFEIELYRRELHLPPDMFTLIPNGVEVPDIHAVASEPVVASIGRLERYKGHHRVMAAFPLVVEARPETRLWIVGEGPEEASLRSQAAELGVADRVDFMSVPGEDRTAMATLVARARLVVSMSEFETHPLVALEAVAGGRRPLVADTSGLHELAEAGLAIPVALDSRPRDLADAIIGRLGAADDAVTYDLPTWDDCADSLLELYRQVTCTS